MGGIYCTVEGREGFSVGCNMPRDSGRILPFNCNSRSRSGGQGSRASKASEVFSSRRLPLFVPIAIETLDAMGHKALSSIKELARHIHLATEDNQAHHHLIQRLSEAVQRVNAAAVLGCIGVGLVS